MSLLKELNIPHMGSVENAKLLSWAIREGQVFAEGDILFEIETDKTATEVEATEAGILVRCLVEPDAEMKVGDLVGLWAAVGTPAADIEAAIAARDAAPAATDSPEIPNEVQVAGPVASDKEAQRLSPLVRRLATEHGVDLARVTGTGPSGRITGDDVIAAAVDGVAESQAPAGSEEITHSLRRQTIARRMTEAAAIPTLTADMEIDLTGLFAYREREKSTGHEVSVLAIIVKEVVAVLRETYNLNAHWTDRALVRFEPVHLGIAVETGEGLIVPVIHDAHTLDTPALTAAIASLAERARGGQLKPADLEGGTFTISNPGALGPVIRAEALLNPPQIALLGLPGIVRVPSGLEVGGDWTVEVRPVIRPSLSFDHRAVDGGPVIQFLNNLKERLEQL